MPLAEYPNAGRGNWLFREDYYRRSRAGRKIFRLQVYPVYKVEQEQQDFQKFLETGKREVDPNDPAIVEASERIKRGRAITRV